MRNLLRHTIRAWLLAWLLVTQCAHGQNAASNRLLVVAPERFHAALREFVAYKSKQIPTELVSLEKILRQFEGADDPEKVKRFLFAQWHDHNAGYALLVGDADVFPVRYMVLDRATSAAFDYAFYPCDLYYGDLAKADGSFDDWNAHHESFHAGYFGEVRGEKNKTDPINYDQVSYHPKIAVGRWPVDTEEQVRRVAAKSMRFEQGARSSPPSESRRVAFLAVGGWVDSRPLLQKLAEQMPGGWKVTKSYYTEGGQYDTPPPTEKEIDQILNDGADLVCHTGHGSDDSWHECFYLPHLDRLTNTTRLPVMISAGCSTARFATLPPYEPYMDVNGKEHAGTDHGEVFHEPPPPPACYQSGRFDPTGLGKELVRRGETGAVAYIGCDTGSQPCALTLLAGFIDTLHSAATPRLGDCWVGAINFYYDHEHLADLKPNDDWYPPSIFFQGMKFMLFGDPSLQMPAPGKTERN